MFFAGTFPGGNPTTASQCNGATFSWVAARSAGGTLYWIVGYGTARGRWVSSIFLGSFCKWDLVSGTFSVQVNKSPYNDYRLLVRAFGPSGSGDRRGAGIFAVDPRVIE